MTLLFDIVTTTLAIASLVALFVWRRTRTLLWQRIVLVIGVVEMWITRKFGRRR